MKDDLGLLCFAGEIGTGVDAEVGHAVEHAEFWIIGVGEDQDQRLFVHGFGRSTISF